MANRRAAELSRNESTNPSPATSRSASGSSKASSPPEQNNQTDYQFLNFSHPSEAKASRARKTVRSHVTKQQHQREARDAAARRARSFPQPMDLEGPEDLPATRPHAATFPPNRPALDVSQSSGSFIRSPEASSQSPSPINSPLQTSQQRLDLADVYPDNWRSSLPIVIEHFLSVMAADIPDLEGSNRRMVLRSHFFPFCLTDAALLHAFILIASTHHSSVHGSQSHTIDLLQLRGMAMNEVNGALPDRIRGTSDQMIAAITLLAAYEALSGNHDISRAHMTGLTQMVRMRGGLPALGLDGLLERALLWVDSNTAHITGSRIYFDQNTFHSSVNHPRPDPHRFSGRSPQRQSS